MKMATGFGFTLVGWMVIAVATPNMNAFSAEYLAISAGTILVAIGSCIQVSA